MIVKHVIMEITAHHVMQQQILGQLRQILQDAYRLMGITMMDHLLLLSPALFLVWIVQLERISAHYVLMTLMESIR